MPITAVYVRISRDVESTRLGVKRQRVDCEKLCADRSWSPVQVYEDNDISAFSGKKRPAYLQLLADVGSGLVDRIVAWHPDRLHRSPRELEDFIDTIEAAGCDVVTVTAGHYDLSTPEGRMTARIIGSVARHESEHKSRRVTRKLAELADAGVPHFGGTRPFGYQRVRGADGRFTLVVDQAEAAIIREMMARYLAGESLYSLRNDLDARKVPTVNGGSWLSSGTLIGILTRPLIAGQRTHDGVVVGVGQWEAIVSPEDVANARAVLEFRRSTKPKRTSPSHVLNGVVVCGNCGGPLYAGTRSYRTKNRVLRCRVAPGCVTVVRDDIVEIVTEAVLKRFDNADLASHSPAKRRGNTTLDDVRHAEAQLAELAGAYADRVISLGEWKIARDRVQQRLEQAQAAAGRSLTTTRALIPFRGKPGALRKAWLDMSIPQRHAVFAAAIERVTVHRLNGSRAVRDRIDIVWRDAPSG